jgi:hypothetical protein
MLSEIICADLRRRVQRNVTIFAYNVIYSLDIPGVEAAYCAKIQQYIQTIRRLFLIKYHRDVWQGRKSLVTVN